jgi:hypothetical protein
MTAAPGESRKRVVVVCQLDGFANGARPPEIARFLRGLGHDVTLVDTFHLSRASDQRGSLRSRLPRPTPRHVALYAVEALSRVLRGWGLPGSAYPLLVADHGLRRRILASALDLADVDLLVCETPHDAGVLLDASGVRTLYDCPTPWADELRFEGRLTARQHTRLRRREARLFEGVDHLAFHWHSYARYVLDHYGITGRNLLRLDWGCHPAPRRARHALPARIVYLGSLGSRFIDLPLLGRLCAQYPGLDVYGGPEPDPRLGVRYRGYASPDVLTDYQFGLVTCTDDPLRRAGFSAKHLAYLSAGLPVLAPEWRRGLEELKGSIAYNETDFADVVAAHSERDRWQTASDAAYAQSQQLDWDLTLQPLRSLLE